MRREECGSPACGRGGDRWHPDGQPAKGERIARIDNYFFSPDLFAQLGAELGVPVPSNGRRWWFSSGQRHECPIEATVAAAAAERTAEPGAQPS